MNSGAPTNESECSTQSIEHIQNPNRLWAFPVIGGTVKLVLVIPVSVWLLCVDFAAIMLSYRQRVLCALHGQVLATCLCARRGFNAAHSQSQLLLSWPQRYISWVFVGFQRRRTARVCHADPAEPPIGAAARWWNLPVFHTLPLLHLLVRYRNPGRASVLVYLDSRAPHWKVSRGSIQSHGLCAAAPAQAVCLHVWVDGPLSVIRRRAWPGRMGSGQA